MDWLIGYEKGRGFPATDPQHEVERGGYEVATPSLHRQIPWASASMRMVSPGSSLTTVKLDLSLHFGLL
jgi:hypothetical protein